MNILTIHAENTASASAIAVDTEVGYASDDIGVTQEIWAAGVAEAVPPVEWLLASSSEKSLVA